MDRNRMRSRDEAAALTATIHHHRQPGSCRESLVPSLLSTVTTSQ